MAINQIKFQRTYSMPIIVAQHLVNVPITNNEKGLYAPFNHILVSNQSTEDISVRKGAGGNTDILMYVPAGVTMTSADTGFTEISIFNEDAVDDTTANEIKVTIQKVAYVPER